MAESSFFFTSSGGDRKYTSANFATFFYELTQRGEGVIKSIDNELAVTNPGTLSVDINTGTSVKRGYLYNNSTSLNKALDAVTSGSQRIDRIVTRVDLTVRTMSIVIVKGTESASPSVPSIDGTTDVLLAKILVNNTSGTPVYTVTDERVYRTAIASIGGMTAADALSGVTPSTVGKSMLSAADKPAQQALVTAGAVGIAALNAVSLTTVTGFKAADTANVAGTTPGTRGLTALSQATTLDADTVGGLSGVPVGSIALHGSTTVPTGWLACDGSTGASRTTYATLFATINPIIGTFTASIANPTVVTLASHGLISGDVIYLTTTATLPTGLTANTQLYWVTVINSSTFNVSTTFANYVAGTKVQVTGSGSGTHTARRCPWGLGDGSTTFTLPDLREAAPVGIGTRGVGVAPDTYNLGQFKDDQLQGLAITVGVGQGSHSHNLRWTNTGGASAGTTTNYISISPSAGSIHQGALTGPTDNTVSIQSNTLPAMTGTINTDGTNGTPRTGTTTRGKRVGVNYIIKY